MFSRKKVFYKSMVLGVIIFFLIFACNVYSAEKLSETAGLIKQLMDNGIITGIGVCVKTDKPPVVDGKVEDKEWEKSFVFDGFKVIDKNTEPAEKTVAYMLYDDKNIYVGFKCSDSQPDKIKTTIKDRDGFTFADDSVEVFIIPPDNDFLNKMESPLAAYHLIINSAGVLFDEPVIYKWKDWDSSVKPKTSVNKNGWEVEMAIPFSDLNCLAPKKGDTWRLNLNREFKREKQQITWATVKKSFHNTENYGTLVFTNKKELVPDMLNAAARKQYTFKIESALMDLRDKLKMIVGTIPENYRKEPAVAETEKNIQQTINELETTKTEIEKLDAAAILAKYKEYDNKIRNVKERNSSVFLVDMDQELDPDMNNPAIPASRKITYPELVKKLYDLKSLALLPEKGETSAQWSSYDRASKYDEKIGKYIGWDANGDGDGHIRNEGKNIVMAEMKGPGCIYRMWSATAGAGRVKIYIDGAKEPVINLPFAEYFNGKNFPFVYPSLVHNTASGLNNYVPIPYKKSCKITAETGWGDYFHFNYVTFPEGTIVPSFSAIMRKKDAEALKKADMVLSNPANTKIPLAMIDDIDIKISSDIADKIETKILASAKWSTETKKIKIPAGKTVKIAKLKGENAIVYMNVKTSFKNRQDECDALRELALSIYWDGEKEPSVWSPLGDFFGTGPGVNKYQSYPIGMTEDGFYSNWYMPFEKSALIEIKNDGTIDREIEFKILYKKLDKPAKEYGRFHAKWHRDAFLPKEPERWIDWTVLKTEGRGRFTGMVLNIWNPKGDWWGEGDEKFHVDGEKFPSTFGTGSEDYFGYAWCNPALFQNAFHNQTLNDGDNFGNISVNRWHIADNIPFQKSFDGYIEKYFPNSSPTLYSAVAYWYLSPGGTDPFKPVPLSERKGNK